MWQDGDSNLHFVCNALISGHFTQQRTLRTLAQEATLWVIADSRMRRFASRNKYFKCADVQPGRSAPLNKSVGRRSAPKWCGPEAVIGTDAGGVTAKFQGQSYKVARYCVRRRVDPEVAGSVEWDPASRLEMERGVRAGCHGLFSVGEGE